MIGIEYTLHCGNIHHSKRQKIYRSNFSDNFLHLPAAFMIFGFTTSWCFPPEFRLHLHWLLERSSWVKLCVHWSWRCTLIETNLETVSMLQVDKQLSCSGEIRESICSKMNPFRPLHWKYVYWGEYENICRRGMGIYINRCKHTFI